MTKISNLFLLFLGIIGLVNLAACGKKGTALPPEGCDNSAFVEFVECDFNSFPDTNSGTSRKQCPPEKFPHTYPPE